MDSRKSNVSKSVFYRGISLKEYLRKSAVTQPNLQYKDDETILVDENYVPVKVEDNFILTEPCEIEMPSILENRSANFEELEDVRNSRYLPSLRSGKQMKTKTKSFLTERNSTDTSLGSSFDLRTSVLPSLQKKQMIRERNITMASRNSSRETSCRKKLTQVIKEAEQCQEEPTLKEKSSSNKQYKEMMKKDMMLRRYNIRGVKVQNNKLRYFDRVKSYAE